MAARSHHDHAIDADIAVHRSFEWYTLMKAKMIILILLTACSDACAGIIYQGQTHTLFQTTNNVQIMNGSKVVFDAYIQARRLLNSSVCKKLSYRIVPLSKVGSIFSFLQEIYLDGGDCGIRGYSYQLGIMNIDLKTGRSNSLFKLSEKKIVMDLIRKDPYLKKFDIGSDWLTRDLDQSFFEWNTAHCATTVSKDMFQQFYIFDAQTRPAKVRLALPYTCAAPADNLRTPTQIGLLLSIDFNKADDFDFLSIRDKVGQGVQLILKRS